MWAKKRQKKRQRERQMKKICLHVLYVSTKRKIETDQVLFSVLIVSDTITKSLVTKFFFLRCVLLFFCYEEKQGMK